MIWLLAYLIGCVAAYLISKKLNLLVENKWTIGDRNFVLLISLVSWTTFISAICIYIVAMKIESNDNRPAKW